MMPMNIRPMFIGVSTTAKPCINAPISSMTSGSFWAAEVAQ
jgi:hypothetical protein